MATSFIKKNWQKDASQTLLNAGARIVGGMAGGFICSKIGSGTGNGSKTLNNIEGPILTVLGVLGDMMVEQPQVKALCQGMTVYGAMHSVATIAPDTIGAKIGVNGFAGFGDTEAEEEDATLMATVDENYSGDITANDLKALQSGQVQNDGNDWSTAADQIDYDGAVQGADDEENAELMGDGDPDSEVAELMGDVEQYNEEAADLMGLGDYEEEADEETQQIIGMF